MSATTSTPKSIDDKILKNFYKQSADKIIQNLDKVREDRNKNSRRWIWELMQNAKDVDNRFKQVSIRIRLQSDQLSFSHNGNSFSEDNLISLVQQVSSKDSENEDEEVTGKFGTGFISTHLLSDIIHVKGVLKRDSGMHQRFNITLDRQAEKSENLVPLIEKTIEKIRKLDEDADFQLEEDYESKRLEEDCDTTFVYPLKDEAGNTAAITGLEELINTLPVTLIFLGKIKNVVVVDDIAGSTDEYHCKLEKSESGIDFFTVTRSSTVDGDLVYHFLKKHSENVQLVIPVSDFNDFSIIIPTGKTPVLYRDFPLIGSERFYFPFYLNGLSFHPTEDRDGILIKGLEKKPEHNRTLLIEARAAAIQFTDFLLEKKAKNLFVIASTRLPFVPDINEETKKWLVSYQKEWRSQIVDKKLVETSNEPIRITDLKVPVSQYSSKKEDDERMHAFVSDLLGQHVVPRLDILDKWVKVFEPRDEYETWGIEALYNEEKVLKTIQAGGDLKNLVFHSSEISNELDKVKWLNKFISYLGSHKQLEQLDSFTIVPNEYGTLNKISILWWENKADPIADEVLDILKSLNTDWRKGMIKRGIDFEGLPKKENGLANASKAITDILTAEKKDKNVVVYDFLKEANAKEVLISILSLITENVDKESFRYKIFLKAKEFFGFEQNFRIVQNLNTFSFNEAATLLTRLLNSNIESCKTIDGLSKKISKAGTATTIWLNSYLKLLEESKAFNYLIEYGNIVPNRIGDLCAFEDLHNFGTEDQTLDIALLNILKKLDAKQDWFPKLVADGISIKLKKTFKFEELTNQIELFVNDIFANEKLSEYRAQLLDLIDWCNNKNNTELKRKYLNNFEAKSSTIFFILTIRDSEYNQQIVELMKKPEDIPVLVAIAESGIPLDKMQTLLNSVKESGQLTKVMEYAKELEREKKDFEFKLKIGKSAEEYFGDVLKAENLNAEVKYIGTGSHDFVVTNPTNKKEFYIELKSHSNGDTTTPIKLAISQARLAVEDSPRFGLCVLERPQSDHPDIIAYIKTNLKYLGGLGTDFSSVVEKSRELDSIIRDQSSISLELKDPGYSVRVSHAYIGARQKPFADLISKIKVAID